MPYYDYMCPDCGFIMKDHRKGISEPHPTKCPECVKDGLVQSYADHDSMVQYKGKGWFKTDGKY